MTVVRVSKGRFDPSRLAEVERVAADSEAALRRGLESLAGLLRYYVGVDREHGYVINVSVWSSLEAAKQMDHFQPMLDQRPIMQAAGVEFETITNNEVLWNIGG